MCPTLGLPAGHQVSSGHRSALTSVRVLRQKGRLFSRLFRDQNLALLFLGHPLAAALLHHMRLFVGQKLGVFGIARFGEIDIVALGESLGTEFLANVRRIAAECTFTLLISVPNDS